MISYQFGLICENAIIDQQTNQLSVFNVYDDFSYDGDLPVLLPMLTLITSWSIDPDEVGSGLRSNIRITLENGSDAINSIFANEHELIFDNQKRRMRLIHQLRGFPLEADGMYAFIVDADTDGEWKEVGRIPYFVNKQNNPEDIVTTSPE